MKQHKRKRLPLFLTLLAVLLLVGCGWLWFDSHYDRSGWQEKDGIVFYQDFHGKPLEGWQEIDGETYYFQTDRGMATGWRSINGVQYHFDDDGALSRGWREINGGQYYFGNDGVPRTLWTELEGSRYYFRRDGRMVTGWEKIDGRSYYFGDDGVMATGWQEIGADRYYFLADGIPVVGSATLEDGDYYFREDGSLFTGWLDRNDNRYYYNPDGCMARAWAEIDGKHYYFDDSGVMQTGWHAEGEYRYYLQEDGSAAVGPTQIDGATYYFTPDGIQVVLVNRSNPVPGYYTLNLQILTEWHQVAEVALEPLQRMLADCVTAGNEYIFNSGYRTLAQQRLILESRASEYEARGMTPDNALTEALKTVAVPGTSEHHLGLAVDILGDDAIAWLTEHCWDYGFIVRYRAEKEAITGIIDEPWHFRYVGIRVSREMQYSDLCLEEYLGAA